MALTWSRFRYFRNNLRVLMRKYGNILVVRHPKACISVSSCSLKNQEGSNDELATKATSTVKKKDTSGPLPKAYDPQYVESDWYDWWENKGFFSPDYEQTNKFNHTQAPSKRADKPFVVCLPPPNVTGTLHLGHALGNSIQDAIVRWHRMRGVPTLWNPGCDHAGIATQVVVEKQLYRESGLTRHDVGRDAFVRKVWAWKQQKGDTIYHQMRRLGSSLDWERACFTLDPKLSRAVTEAFIRLHEAGTIYRKRSLVNWSCALKSAISDIEVEDLELQGKTYLEVPGYDGKVPFGILTDFKYPVENSDETITIATTRPETMLGDVAIAVHPDDPRYTHLHGNRVVHPFTGRRLPIICDDFVSREFGTGAVKLTPAHDPRDQEVGERHSLDAVSILTEDGRMDNVPQGFKGLPRFEARDKVIEALSQKGLLGDVRDHAMSLPLCSRSKDVIEPMLRDQWFVSCQAMAARAQQAVASGELELIPPQYEKQWNEWLGNIRDWCISRQLWWGHRIPAYRVFHKDEQSHSDGAQLAWVSAHSAQDAADKASHRLGLPTDALRLEQDEDVLDTWFSSALFPFSIFAWPDQTADLDRFYPTSLLETAGDIIFFWVARMVMLGQELTGQLPFKQVLFHSILRDSYGRKMSKSLGNIIDPLDVVHGVSLQSLQDKIDNSNLSSEEKTKAKAAQQLDFPNGIPECGSDALRFTLCSYNYKALSINLDMSQIVSSRHFCNKIWQGFRLVDSMLGSDYIPPSADLLSLSPTDAWLLSRLSWLVQRCDTAFTSYDLRIATDALYTFWWHDFCDVYLEYSKAVSQTSDPATIQTLHRVLHLSTHTFVRTLAPFMPYLAEELYQRVPGVRVNSVCIAEYPEVEQYPWRDHDTEAQMTTVRSAVSSLMSLRKELNLTRTKAKVTLQPHTTLISDSLQRHLVVLQTLSRSSEVLITDDKRSAEISGCVRVEGDGLTAYMELQGIVDFEKEKQRINKQLVKVAKDLERAHKQTNRGAGVPEHIAQAAEQKISDFKDKQRRLESTLEALSQTNS